MVQELSQESLIIGAGVIGLAIARELHRNGLRKITVIDRGTVGGEASHVAGGMLAVQAETDSAGNFFDLCRAGRDAYPDFAAAIAGETGIDIELDRGGTLYLAFTEADSREIAHRHQWQSAAGLNVERLTDVETRKLEPFVSPDVRESLVFPDDWQVDNRKMVAAFRQYATNNSITIREHVDCRRLIVKNGRVIGAETSEGKIYAQRTILAAGAWTSLIDTSGIEVPVVRPIRGQIFGLQTAKRLFTHVIYSPRGYIVPRADGRIIAGSTTEDVGFEKAVTPAGVDRVTRNTFEISPALSGLPIVEKCSGLRPKSNDALPVIGAFPHVENLFVATAHYRNGILLAPLTGRIVADLVAGQSPGSALAKPFGPERFISR